MTTKSAFITALGGANATMGISGAVFTAVNATNHLVDVAHGRVTGDGPFRITHAAALFDQVPTGLAPYKSTGVLTGTTIADTNTVTINGKVYTFQATLTDVDGNVHVGATDSDSLDNLINAINLGAGAGTDYATSMTLHPTVGAVAGAGDTMDVIAKTAGVAGDALTTTASLTAGDFGAAVLAGGLDAIDYWIIKLTDDNFQFATTKALAIAGTAVAFTDDGVNALTMNITVQHLADKLEGVLDEVLLSPGNKVNMQEVNTTKFWTAAESGV